MDESSKHKQYFSILQWIVERGILSEKGEAFDFYDRPFLLDILTDWNREIVVEACAQVGKTVVFSIKTLFAMKHLRMNLIYTHPTDSAVREFASSKFNPLIRTNIEEFAGMEVDSVERKEYDGRFVFFKGTESTTGPISTTADVLVHDEISRSNQIAINTYKSRTKASDYKGRWMFSNPGTERDELDLQWERSDQKEWTITCPHCKDQHYLSWPDSVDPTHGCYICKACKEPISNDVRRQGEWVAQRPGSKISGYHISHLMCLWIPVSDIIDDSKGDPAYFNNFVLGRPYSPGDLSVTRTTILDLWTPKDLFLPQLYLGVDVGNIKHWILRSNRGLVKMGRFSEWAKLDEIIDFYKPTAGVIDAMPDNFMAKHYVATYPFMQMSFFMENNNNPQTIVWWGEKDKAGIVYSHRDRILDQHLTRMVEAAHLIGVTPDKEFQLFIKHYETLRRVKVVNAKGIERYVWESTTGEDHYVFADLYSYLALLSSGSGTFFGEVMKEDISSVLGADNTYDISRMFHENNE